MEDYPKTLLEFERRFASDESCREYLAALRWPEGFRCPRCGHERSWLNSRGLCECAACHRQTSVIAGTIFQDTRKPLTLWFRAMWYVTSQKTGVSALGLQRVLGLGSYETAWAWLHKLRRAMVRPGRDRLQGTVEVDETYWGGERPGKRGRGAEGKSLVVVAAEEDVEHHDGATDVCGDGPLPPLQKSEDQRENRRDDEAALGNVLADDGLDRSLVRHGAIAHEGVDVRSHG